MVALRELSPHQSPEISPQSHVSEVGVSEWSKLIRNHRRAWFHLLLLQRKRRKLLCHFLETTDCILSSTRVLAFGAARVVEQGSFCCRSCFPGEQGLFDSQLYHSSRLPSQDSLPSLFPQRERDASAPRWGLWGSLS